jgi:Kef-type K+ transport system membrane component KefB
MSAAELSVAYFLQMFLILLACRVMGVAARRVGQPQVMGEMIAGVVLGPSLLGLLSPGLMGFLFPPDSLKVLFVGAQLGIGLYMFLVGVEFDVKLFRARARSAVAVSVSGMVAPLVLGAGLAVWLVRVPGLFAESVTTFEAMLFLGAAMAITAFPVLARIIHERGLTGTPLGTLTLAAGAIDDATAWCVLAIVLASFGSGPAVAVRAIVGGVAFALFVVVFGRRLLKPLGRAAERAGGVTPPLLAVTLMLFAAAAWMTDMIGIHAVFGGFVLGTAMPRGVFARDLRQRLEPFTVVFLLPMFFTFTGLNTRLDVVRDPGMLMIALAVLAAAIVGKAGACAAAARLSGEDLRTSLAVGTLMNARGLMELILLSIGLQRGLILRPLFSIMVLMAIVTTWMASPLFERVYRREGPIKSAPGGPRGPGSGGG